MENLILPSTQLPADLAVPRKNDVKVDKSSTSFQRALTKSMQTKQAASSQGGAEEQNSDSLNSDSPADLKEIVPNQQISWMQWIPSGLQPSGINQPIAANSVPDLALTSANPAIEPLTVGQVIKEPTQQEFVTQADVSLVMPEQSLPKSAANILPDNIPMTREHSVVQPLLNSVGSFTDPQQASPTVQPILTPAESQPLITLKAETKKSMSDTPLSSLTEVVSNASTSDTQQVAIQNQPSSKSDEASVSNQKQMGMQHTRMMADVPPAPVNVEKPLVEKQLYPSDEHTEQAQELFIVPVAQSAKGDSSNLTNSGDDPHQFETVIAPVQTDARSSLTNPVRFELPEPVEAMPDKYDISGQVFEKARMFIRPTNSEMVLQLRPEHLGELTLKVSVENGLVTAAFHSDNREVRQVIEASLPQLKQDLSQQGIKLDNVGVFNGSEQFFGNDQQQSQRQQQPQLLTRKSPREFTDVLEATETVSLNSTEGVDYRI